MNINDYIQYVHQNDNIKICNISTNTITNLNDCSLLTSIVKLIGIKRNTITFYI